MAGYVTLHLYNSAKGQDVALNDFIVQKHAPDVLRLRGIKSFQRFEITEPQLMDGAAQPWKYLSLYEFDFKDAQIDVPALAPLLANIRDAGLIADDHAERSHTFEMYSPWWFGAHHKPGPFDHLYFILANFTPGREEEYHKWYDSVHRVEICATPGFAGMRRGTLSSIQVAPFNHHPGEQVVLGAVQTDDIAAACKEFVDRARDNSPSGIAWAPRSKSASVARTVHMTRSIAGPFTK